MGKKGLVAYIIILVILGILGSFFYLTYQNQLDQINSLKASYNALLTSYNDLQTSYNDLDKIVNLKKQTTLSNNQIVNLASNTFTILLYSTPYAGYIKIDFTASVEVYFWVQSSLTNAYYSRYPASSPDNATSGSFIIPVLSGITLLSVYNPTLTIGASMYITVTYVY